ncbi:MAG: deoxyguanosinetriphosphate triphosphohydrolase family protein [Lachnospiraceae bacterium]
MKEEALLMIKIINRNLKLVHSFEESFVNQQEGKYKVVADTDKKLLDEILAEEKETDYYIISFIFTEDYKVEYIYVGKCKLVREEGDIYVYFEIKKCIRHKMVIDNILSYSELDLDKDFKHNSYVNIEYSGALIKQVKELLFIPELSKNENCEFKQSRKEEEYLHPYAQHNENCKRLWGGVSEEKERSEFQRDRERIVNSKAFRRMVDKAQIFTSSKGDHYRTRMTHTLEVAQIARSIANSLRLNIDLTEAIALGHDLGHTPFGHQGERTLDDIINGRTEILEIMESEGKNPYGGFKHNFQSLRMLTKLEEKYINHPGLDVSYQLLEGVLKHTSSYFKNDCRTCEFKECKKGCCDSKEFIDPEIYQVLYPEFEFATTLEGQVVAIADEIAQRSHDIDDSFSSKLLSFDEFQDYLRLNKLKPLRDIIQHTFDMLEEQQTRILVSRQEMLTARIVSDIIGYLVNDVVRNSRIQMENFDDNLFYITEHRFDKKLIGFSEEGQEVCNLLEQLISKRAINCLEVTRFDRNAEQVVKFLFKAYYENPRLIHEGTLRRMYIDMLSDTDNVIDFVKADPKLVREEFQRITEYVCPDNHEEWTERDQEYYQKRKILVRNIVDFIAGMTDSYAMNEYRLLS